MYCSKCGKEIKEGTRFCGGCGAPVVIQNMQPEMSANNTDKQRTTQSKKCMVMTAAIVLMIGGVLVLILKITKKYPVQLVFYDVVTENQLTDGVELSFYQGEEEDGYQKTPTETIQTDENGQAEIKLREGVYTVEVSLVGYQTTYLEVEAKEDGTVYSQYLVPEIPEGQCMVLLKWDGEGTDLDLTIFTPKETNYAGGSFSIDEDGNLVWEENTDFDQTAFTNSETEYIGGKFLSDDYGNYMLSDNQSGYEVAYIDTSVNGDYRIYVNDYTDSQAGEYDSTNLSGANARVRLFDHTGLLADYALSEQEEGVVWEVAKVNGSNVTESGEVYAEMGGKRWWLVDKYKKWLMKEIHYAGDGSMTGWDEYSYDSEGNETKKVSYDGNGSTRGWEEYSYDNEGNIIKEVTDGAYLGIVDYEYILIEYDGPGNQSKGVGYNDDGSMEILYESEYDDEGNVTRRVYYDIYGGINQIDEYDNKGILTKVAHYKLNGSLWWEEEYDNEGKQTKEVSYSLDGNISGWNESEYDNDGNKIKQINYNGNGDISSWYEYEYDDIGNKTKEIGYNNDGSINIYHDNCEWGYKYDSEGNILEQVKYHDDGRVSSRSKYDSEGNILEQVEYRGDGSVLSQSEWGYEYDSEGNMLKKVYYMEDGNVGFWTEYIYE